MLRAAFPKLRFLVLAGLVAALAGCASNRAEITGSIKTPDFSGQTRLERQDSLSQLAERYKRDPKNKSVILYYSAALRANGQSEQAMSVLEDAMAAKADSPDIRVAYAKALATGGRFDQALNVVESAINPSSPDWNALLVKGAILDQSGRSAEARVTYQQALTVAPQEASLHANLGLSYAMTNELDAAEMHLRIAVKMRGATSQIRQNLALVVGLQGRFDESRAMFAAELAADQVEANMNYIRALLTQQNRWDLIKGDEAEG